MIEGLKFDISSAELKELLDFKWKSHATKAEQYRTQIANLQDAQEAGTFSNDPTFQLKGSLKAHEKNATYFKLLADKVVPDETYRLAEHEYQRVTNIEGY
jgi:hypothetical protein